MPVKDPARIALDWPPELVQRYRLEDVFSHRVDVPLPDPKLTTA